MELKASAPKFEHEQAVISEHLKSTENHFIAVKSKLAAIVVDNKRLFIMFDPHPTEASSATIDQFAAELARITNICTVNDIGVHLHAALTANKMFQWPYTFYADPTRRFMIDHFSWAQPSQTLINNLVTKIIQLTGRPKANILDLCSGRGYWAFLFHNHAAVTKVIAIDNQSDQKDPVPYNDQRYYWFPPVVADMKEYLAHYRTELKDYVLFISWPRSGVMACIELFQGDVVIIIHESCTDQPADERMLELGWSVVPMLDDNVLCWPCIHDTVTIYHRTTKCVDVTSLVTENLCTNPNIDNIIKTS